MLAQFPKTEKGLRLSKLLYFLAKYCSGLDAELKKSGSEVLQAKWSPIIDNLTDSQLSVGCNWIKTHDEQFIQPQRFRFIAHGLIDPPLAYEYAKSKKYPHLAIYDAACRANIYYAHGTDDWIYDKFKRAYNFICDSVLNGETLNPQPRSIENKPKYKKRPPITAYGEKALGNIRAILGRKPTIKEVDHD